MATFAELVQGFYAVPAFTLLGELGLIDRWLAGEQFELGAWLKQNGLDEGTVRPCVEYFRFLGLLEKDGDVYRPTEAGRGPLGSWGLAMVHFAYTPLIDQILPLARKEKKYGYGQSVYRNMYFDTKGSGLTGIKGGRFQRVVDWFVSQKRRCLLDLGCGDGTFLAHAASLHPTLEVIGLDQSEVSLANAKKTFERQGLAGRATFLQGDLAHPEKITSREALQRVDVATIWYILHELTYESIEPAIEFLRQFKRALPKVELGVTEVYRLPFDDLRAYGHRGIMEMTLVHDLSRQNMLAREQWLGIYESAGYRVTHAIAHVTQDGAKPAMETVFLAPT